LGFIVPKMANNPVLYAAVMTLGLWHFQDS